MSVEGERRNVYFPLWFRQKNGSKSQAQPCVLCSLSVHATYPLAYVRPPSLPPSFLSLLQPTHGIHRRPSPEGLGRLVVQPSIVDMRFRLSEIVVVKVGVGAGGEEVTPAGEGVEVLVFPRFKEEDFLASFCL